MSPSRKRHRYFMYCVRSIAVDMADRILRGEPLPPAVVEAADEWVRDHGRAPGAGA